MNQEYANVDALATAKFFIAGEKHEEAKAVLDLVKPYCKSIPQMDAIGKLYSEIRDNETCLEIAKTIYCLLNEAPEETKKDLRSNIIRALLNLNRPYDALDYIEEQLYYHVNDQPTLLDKALALFLLNRKKEAEAIIREVAKHPHTQDVLNRINFNLGTYDLANGDFQKGLRGFLLEGRKLDIWKKHSFPSQFEWKGDKDIKGRNLILSAEGGIGDEIISVRFMKHLKDLGANPIWHTSRKDLAEVFNRNGFKTITDTKQIPPDSLWAYSMAVPCYLNVKEEDLWYGPYLKAREKLDWNNSLIISNKNPKIGIKCNGNPKYDQDLHRSIPVDLLIDSLPKDVNIYSLHKDEKIDNQRVIDLQDNFKTWEDTLDILSQLDIVVTSCTSIAHAASAMGKRTIVLVPILNYYTWAKPGTISPWYSGNTTILRQTEYDNWNAPLKELKDMLNESN